MTKYYVDYEVEGFPGIQTAGPYSMEDVHYQYNDIISFEKVKNAQVRMEETNVEEN